MTALTHLSLQRVGYRATPHVPTNDDRIRAYRQYMPTQFANSMFPHGSVPLRCRPAPARFPEAGNYSDPFAQFTDTPVAIHRTEAEGVEYAREEAIAGYYGATNG